MSLDPSLLSPDSPASVFLPELRRFSAMVLIGVLGCSVEQRITPPNLIELDAITVASGPRILERGTRDTLTATVVDANGDTVDVAVAWRSTNENVAVFERGGVLVALAAGTTVVQASSLGVQSDPVSFQVVWTGPAKITAAAWSPSTARSPGMTLSDSIRVIVTNAADAPVANAKVSFSVAQGGGSVSPTSATTNLAGVAAAAWTMGPSLGDNSVTASVVTTDGSPDTLVVDNVVTFSTTTYNALTIQDGDNQTALLLAGLPTQPSVKLVDSDGTPRTGVPVTFTAFQNGRVTFPTVSTGSDGVATPGTWTLGDAPGTQTLEARVEDARVSFNATATGTPVYYTPAGLIAGGASSCARESDGSIKCWGAVPQSGIGDTVNVATPTLVKGTLVAASLAGGPSHNCALTSQGLAWCWGFTALVDTTGPQFVNTFVPTRVKTDIQWTQISPGQSHNCAITLVEAAYCWGFNSGGAGGQLGDGTTTDRFVPTPVAGGFKFSQIASGTDHTCGLTNGAAFCWGQNQWGQLGDGTTQSRSSPTAAVGGNSFIAIGAGQVFSCALTAQPQGSVYCWGGLANNAQVSPGTYAGAPSFVSLSVGGGHACALTADGTAYCWGANNFGQLGDSTLARRNSPTKVASTLRFLEIHAGFLHTCGLTTAGAVACWGRNQFGELGNLFEPLHLTPRHVVIGVNP